MKVSPILPNHLVCMAVLLLCSSVRSSSFSSPARFGRVRVSSSTQQKTSTFLLRGGDVETGAAATAASPPPPAAATTAAAVITPPSTASTSIAAVSNGGEVEKVNSKMGLYATSPGPLRRLFPSFPWHVLPNYLTYARCLSIPIFLVLCYYPTEFQNRAPTLSIIFALASITDWFDGFLARRWDITSPFGAFLDPVADKLMVSTALIALAGRYGGIVAIPSAIIMAREWMAQQGKRDSVKVGMQGKVKAALTMVSLTLMLLVPEGVGLESVSWTKCLGTTLGVGGAGNVVEGVANTGWGWMLGPSLIMLFASAIITVTSGSVYFRAALPVLLGKE